ncbi:MAG: fused MFS/spermidine synthase, partial [Bdellovibrionales bacterium]|nr:fused MFS/spermidine synthase [Bdellovibrionales bacterium]
MTANHTRSLALIVTLFTGSAGLVYEVTWHRYLANLIGSQARAAAIILAVFLGGLSVGYILFGRFSHNRSPRTLIRMYAWIEILIGAWACLFPLLFNFVWQQVGILNPQGALSIIYDVTLCIVLIAFPTVLMGSTLPLLTQGLARNNRDAASFHARVYALNTAGACLGCLAAGFLLIPVVGLARTLILVSSCNLGAGLLLLYLAPRVSAERPHPKVSHHSLQGHLNLWQAAVVAFLAGFYALSLQTILIRLIGLSVGSSEYSFSMVVAVFILLLAVGAWLGAGINRRGIPLWLNQLVVFLGLAALYFVLPIL